MRRWLAGLLAPAFAWPAAARIVQVGPGGAPTLAAAAAAAHDGDTIRLAAGDYYECAVLTQHDLTIEGPGDGRRAALTDRMCEGKASLVARGDRLTLRDLTLARARVPDRNGAGVRLEGQGLTLERVWFEDNQVGVLAGQGGAGSIRVTDCLFKGGGVAGARPTAALMAGAVASLRVERSEFVGVKGGQVSSWAGRTELLGNRIDAGAEPGAGAAVRAGGGTLLMQGNVIVVGPPPPPRGAAVVASGTEATLTDNRLVNMTGRPQTLLLNWTGAAPALAGNEVGAGDKEASGAGLLRHRAGEMARAAFAAARSAAGQAKRAAEGVLGR